MALRLAALLKRSLIFVHRWLGVALSLVFLLWFVSGIVMMYWSFPSVGPADRLQRAPVLVPERVAVSADRAFSALGRDAAPAQVRLTSFDGRPVYRFGGGGGRGRGGPGGGRGGGAGARVFADDGAEVGGWTRPWSIARPRGGRAGRPAKPTGSWWKRSTSGRWVGRAAASARSTNTRGLTASRPTSAASPPTWCRTPPPRRDSGPTSVRSALALLHADPEERA